MSWSDAYIGIPYVEGGRGFDGCDCAGLVLLVLRLECGIIAKDFTEYERRDFYTPAGRLRLHRGIQNCVDAEWVLIDTLEPFDLVRFRVGKAYCHVGIFVGSNHFLHIEEEGGAVSRLTPMDDLSWGRRFVESRRHVRMQEGVV